MTTVDLRALTVTAVDVRQRRRGRGVAYGLPGAFVGFVSLSWLERDVFIGAGDVSPLVRDGLGAEAFSTWNHQLTGAGGTRTDAARSLEVLFLRFVELLGGSAMLAQQLMLAGVLALAAIGTAHLTRRLIGRPVVAAAAGLLGVFNPFIMLQLPNIIFPLAIGVIGLACGELIGHLRGHPTSALRLLAISAPLAYLSINPPLLLVAVGATGLALAAAAFAGGPRSALGQLWPLARRAVPLLVAVHLWWIVPTAGALLRGPAGVEFAAVTDPETWGWIYAQNSLPRVVTLTAHWGWPFTEYYPWASTMDTWPWVFLRWLLPVGAAAGVVFAPIRHRRLARGVGAVAVVLVLLSQGLHGLAGPVNGFLYETVPGWWLFRDPVSKFGPVLVLLYALAFALLLERLADAATARPGLRREVLGAGALLTALTLAHPFPLFTGAVLAEDRGTLPSTHVQVPDAWDEVAAAVSASPVDGKVAVLPVNDYYQVTTSWGYHGVDLANQFFDRPVIQLHPGGYYSDRAGHVTLVAALEQAVRSGNGETARALMRSLGVSHLVVRRDVDRESELVASLLEGAATLGLDPVSSNDVADLYVGSPGGPSVSSRWVGADAGDTAAAVAATGRPVVALDTAGSTGVYWSPDPRGASVAVPMIDRPTDRQIEQWGGEAEFVATPLGWEIRMANNVSVDGQTLPDRTIARLPLDQGGVSHVQLGDRTARLTEGLTFVMGATLPVQLLTTADESVLERSGPVSDCNQVDDRNLLQVGIYDEVVDGDLRLHAREHTACVSHAVAAAPDLRLLEIDVRSVQGRPARLCLWSPTDERCAATASIAAGALTAREVIAVPAGEDHELFLYADGDDGSETIAEFGPVRLLTVRMVSSVTLDSTTTTTLAATATERRLDHERSSPELLGSFGALSDCNRRSDKTSEEAGLRAEAVPGGIQLAATDHTACVSAPIDVVPGTPIDLRLRASVDGPGSPRVCVWQEGVNTCATAPTIATSSTGDHHAVIQTDPRAERLSFFLYADGAGGATPTIVDYTDVSITLANAPTLLLGEQTPRSAPDLRVLSSTNDHHVVHVTGVRGRFLLTLPESHDEGWSLRLPSGWVASHVEIDGYANGWFIDGEGEGRIGIVYDPARLDSLARGASAATVAATALWVPSTWIARRRKAAWLDRTARLRFRFRLLRHRLVRAR